MKQFFRSLSSSILLASLIFFIGCVSLSQNTPDVYGVTEKSDVVLSGTVPLTIKAPPDADYIKAGFSRNSPGYRSKLTLLNLIPIKSVQVNFVEERVVVPCGIPFGVKLFTNGVVIIGTATVKTESGSSCPATSCGLQKGDVITKVDRTEIKTNEDLALAIEKCEGDTLKLSFIRENVPMETEMTPVKSTEDGEYRAGVWVRDSSAGIGTLTFYDPASKTFSGLGHGICDVDTGELLPLARGEIIEASISGISKGSKGAPGELKGRFLDRKPMGELAANTETGIYGTLNERLGENKSLKVAMKHQVRVGPAKILTTISGETPKYYDVNIESINYNQKNPTKNILLSITDGELIEKTGGIVQGMSGSPIIQNETLVGAVTHVFVNEPNKGYGIFSETMLTNSGDVFENMHRNAS